jgi:hypothetical protein
VNRIVGAYKDRIRNDLFLAQGKKPSLNWEPGHRESLRTELDAYTADYLQDFRAYLNNGRSAEEDHQAYEETRRADAANPENSDPYYSYRTPFDIERTTFAPSNREKSMYELKHGVYPSIEEPTPGEAKELPSEREIVQGANDILNELLTDTAEGYRSHSKRQKGETDAQYRLRVNKQLSVFKDNLRADLLSRNNNLKDLSLNWPSLDGIKKARAEFTSQITDRLSVMNPEWVVGRIVQQPIEDYIARQESRSGVTFNSSEQYLQHLIDTYVDGFVAHNRGAYKNQKAFDRRVEQVRRQTVKDFRQYIAEGKKLQNPNTEIERQRLAYQLLKSREAQVDDGF